MPLFSHPLYSVVNGYYSQEITAQFFFYSKSLEEEFIVYLRQNKYAPFLIFDFFRYNGDYVFTKKQPIPGVRRGDYDKVSVKISPNGRYICYKEQHDAPTYSDSKTYEESNFYATHTERMIDFSDDSSQNEGGASSSSILEADSSDESDSSSSQGKSGINSQNSISVRQATGENIKDVKSISEASSESSQPNESPGTSRFPASVGGSQSAMKKDPRTSSMPIPNSGGTSNSGSRFIRNSTQKNGTFRSKPSGVSGYSNSRRPPSGKFHGLEPYNKKRNGTNYQSSFPRMDEKVFEIVLVRRSSIFRKLMWTYRKYMLNGEFKKLGKLKKKMEIEETIFDLKLVRTVEDVNRKYGDYSDEHMKL